MDSLRSIIDDHSDRWNGKSISIQIVGDISLICNINGVGKTEVSSERSVITVDRAGDDFSSNYSHSIVSIPPEGVTKIISILLDRYRRIGNDEGTETKQKEDS